MIQGINRGVTRLSRVLHQIAAWVLIPLLVSIVLLEITLRTLFGAALSWGHEVLGLLLICLLFMQLPYNVHRRDLLGVDLLYQLAKPRLQALINSLGALATLVMSTIIFWQGYSGAFEMYRYQEQAYILEFPLWPLAALTAVSGLLIMLQTLCDVMRRCDDC